MAHRFFGSVGSRRAPSTPIVTISVGALTEDELPFLREMLLAALFWRGDRELPDEFVLQHPVVAMYHEGWGKNGDLALVARSDAELLGAVWYRFFTEEHHGDGYVDEDTPELAIAVRESFRGRGIGRLLMHAAHEQARIDGVGRISLSVNLDNPARHLYRELGYTDILPVDERERMVIDLR